MTTQTNDVKWKTTLITTFFRTTLFDDNPLFTRGLFRNWHFVLRLSSTRGRCHVRLRSPSDCDKLELANSSLSLPIDDAANCWPSKSVKPIVSWSNIPRLSSCKRHEFNFNYILRAHFSYERRFGSFFSSYNYIACTWKKLPKQCLYEKRARIKLMKLATGYSVRYPWATTAPVNSGHFFGVSNCQFH